MATHSTFLLKIFMDRGAQQARVHRGCKQLDTTEVTVYELITHARVQGYYTVLVSSLADCWPHAQAELCALN